jgi:hypothetical protein
MTSFPDDSALFPFTQFTEGAEGTAGGLTMVQPGQLDMAREITDPGDRSLALQRLAKAAIFCGQLTLAHSSLNESADAAASEKVPLVHDQRLIAIITTYLDLSEAHLRAGKPDMSIRDLDVRGNNAQPVDRPLLINRAKAEWKRAAIQSGLIIDPTYRSEWLYRVVDGMGYGCQTIINDFPTDANPGSAQPSVSYAGPAEQIVRDAAATTRFIERPVWRDLALVAVASAIAASLPQGMTNPGPSDPAVLNEAGDTTHRLFARGLETARMIPQPEVRTDALVRLAEAQARLADREQQIAEEHARIADDDQRQADQFAKLAEGTTSSSDREKHQKDRAEKLADRDARLKDREVRLAVSSRLSQDATPTYREAAVAVASIPLDDPRAVLAGVLIDNLISVGRFEDARSTIILYPDNARRLIALGAIAESQGRRGAADSARAWIMRDVPSEYRSQLLRKVNTGILWSIEQSRGHEEEASGRGYSGRAR